MVLSQVLACDATLGYEEMHNTQVLRFNGTKIRNLAHLAELTTTCTQPFMRFDLDLDVRPPLSTLSPMTCGTRFHSALTAMASRWLMGNAADQAG